VGGGGGIFVVRANGKTIYNNKNHCGQFPEDSDIVADLKKLL
jgi:predicted Rdx family selenoprotein